MFKSTGVIAILVAFVAARNPLIINTPVSVTVCQPTLLTWSGGVPPYFVDILNAKNAEGAVLEDLVSGSKAKQFTWNVDLPAGTELLGRIRDSTGQTRTTATIVVQNGPNTSCL